MSAAETMARRLVEELMALGPVESKKMFGGFGFFCESVMFALVDTQGTALLRSADDGRQFQAMGGHKHGRMPYWSVPAPVLDDREQLIRLGEGRPDRGSRVQEEEVAGDEHHDDRQGPDR